MITLYGPVHEDYKALVQISQKLFFRKSVELSFQYGRLSSMYVNIPWSQLIRDC